MKWFAQFSRRHVVTTSLVLILEILYYRQYAHLGAEFHFWLHGLFGASLGIAALTIWRILKRTTGALSPWESGLLGHLYSSIPDILFVSVGILHMYWMDVFALHIIIHFIPYPIWTMLIIFILTLAAYGLASDGRMRLATSLLITAVFILIVGIIFSDPIPHNLYQVQHQHARYAWLCPMWDIAPAPH